MEKTAGDEAYSGTLVLDGEGLLEADATGGRARIGQIAEAAQEIRQPKTALQLGMKSLSRTLAAVAILFSVAIPVAGYLRGQPLETSILTGLALAFATTPEELPIIITMTLGLVIGTAALCMGGLRTGESLECTGEKKRRRIRPVLEPDPLLLALAKVYGHGPEPGRAVRHAEDREPHVALARDRPEPGTRLVQPLGEGRVVDELRRSLDPQLPPCSLAFAGVVEAELELRVRLQLAADVLGRARMEVEPGLVRVPHGKGPDARLVALDGRDVRDRVRVRELRDALEIHVYRSPDRDIRVAADSSDRNRNHCNGCATIFRLCRKGRIDHNKTIVPSLSSA